MLNILTNYLDILGNFLSRWDGPFSGSNTVSNFGKISRLMIANKFRNYLGFCKFVDMFQSNYLRLLAEYI